LCAAIVRKGILLAASSYVAWGLFPAYFLLLKSVSPVEVLAHRMIWSLVFLSFVLAYRRQWSWLPPLSRKPILVASFAVSAALLSGNWFLYIWAVSNGHVIDASLGYFINPLVNIVLGFVLLHERLHPAQWIAVLIAALGVLWLTWQGHHFPWIAIVLALTFGFYGLMRKVAALGPLEGLSLETLLLFPLGGRVSGLGRIQRKQRFHSCRFGIAPFADGGRADNRDPAAAVRGRRPSHQAVDARVAAIHCPDAAATARHLAVPRAVRRRAHVGLLDHLGRVGLVYRGVAAAHLVDRAASRGSSASLGNRLIRAWISYRPSARRCTMLARWPLG
jgi:RarD protein